MKRRIYYFSWLHIAVLILLLSGILFLGQGIRGKIGLSKIGNLSELSFQTLKKGQYYQDEISGRASDSRAPVRVLVKVLQKDDSFVYHQVLGERRLKKADGTALTEKEIIGTYSLEAVNRQREIKGIYEGTGLLLTGIILLKYLIKYHSFWLCESVWEEQNTSRKAEGKIE